MASLVTWESPDLKVRGYTVAQVPNLPLIVALVAAVVSRFLTDGSFAFCLARAVFYAALAIWAWLELTEGVNGFRRVLGAGGLAFVLYSLARDLS